MPPPSDEVSGDDDDEDEAATQSIIEVATATPDLSTFVSLLSAEGQEDVLTRLAGDGPFTVFAPQNSAFNGVETASLSPEALTDILTYHVVNGENLSSGLTNGDLVALNGDTITVGVEGN